jgi:serine/threonine protein kinase
MSNYFQNLVKKAGEKIDLDKISKQVSSAVGEAQKMLHNQSENLEAAMLKLPVNVPPKIQVENYTVKVVKLLDEGGYSYVFLVKDLHTGEDFALKRLLIQDKEMYTNAKREIEFMKQLSGHENIIKLLATSDSKQGGSHEVYILMELAKDSLISMLQRKLDEGTHFPEEELLNIFLQICKAVGHMHSQNPPVIHRDLKVENVLQTVDGTYKLCDFGSATTQVFNPQSSKRDMLQAEEEVSRYTTMAYRAPEMVDLYSGYSIDTKADVWVSCNK